MSPLPYKEVHQLFTSHASHSKNTEMAQALTAYLANADYLLNRLLVVANQCKMDQKAAKRTELDNVDLDGLRLMSALDRSDSDRFIASAHQA